MIINGFKYALAALFLCMVFMPSMAKAQEPSPTFIDPTIRELTDFLFQQKKIDFMNEAQAKEYVMVEDCVIYDKFYDNDFEWNRVVSVLSQSSDEQDTRFVEPKHFRVPGKMALSRYNFSTQAFDIHEDDLMDNVGFLQVSPNYYKLCTHRDPKDRNDIDIKDIKAIPSVYYLKPEIPLSLFRIPISKTWAKGILEKMEMNRKGNRIVYLDINVTVDAVAKVDKVESREVTAYLVGRVESIDFYTDPYYQDKFKTLYYAGYY